MCPNQGFLFGGDVFVEDDKFKAGRMVLRENRRRVLNLTGTVSRVGGLPHETKPCLFFLDEQENANRG